MSRLVSMNGTVRHLGGWRRDSPDHRDFIASAMEVGKLPPSHDLRPLCPPVRDQAALGSCTCNASVEAMGFLYSRGGGHDPMLSRLYAYYYVRQFEGTPPGEDSGAELRDVMKVLAGRGTCLEGTWPYDVAQFATAPPGTASVEALHHKILFYYRLPSLRTIKASISQGWPCVGGFQVPENMQSTECERTGIVKYPTPTEGFIGGHAVLFVGYDDATSLLTAMNSWGTQWGDKGFLYLPYRFVTEGLAEDFWTVRREEL